MWWEPYESRQGAYDANYSVRYARKGCALVRVWTCAFVKFTLCVYEHELGQSYACMDMSLGQLVLVCMERKISFIVNQSKAKQVNKRSIKLPHLHR